MNYLIEILTSPTVMWSLGIASVLGFVGSLILIPWLVVRIPVDYFSDKERHQVPWAEQHQLIRWILLVMKNLLGMVFLIMGLVMLVLPGQGLLTILIALFLLNFPGKYRLERKIFMMSSVRQAVDWLRNRAGKQPLRFEQ
ncbi:MAG: hypothetical protein JJU48_09165 [Methylophaga sp.]|nr:hypothetical protein [Methylophaga sp.]